MQNFKKLGKVLSKQEQRNLKGGTEDPPPNCIETSGCTSDSNCNAHNADCICGRFTGETNNHCIWEH